MAESGHPLPENSAAGKHIAFVVEVPNVYTDDIDMMREDFADEFETDSDLLSNLLGEPRVVRLRVETARI